LFHPHVPLDQSPDLALGVAARHHPRDEIGVLLLGLAVLLRTEGDHRKKILDLREYPLFDDFADLFVGGPTRILAAVLGPRPQRELHDFVTEVLRIGDAGRLLARRERRIGVLMSTGADDAQGQAWIAAFVQGLEQLGWEVGGNIRIDYRWGAGDTERFRKYAAELVALAPDVILGTAASIVAALQQVSHTIPIVFVSTIDPVGAGLVASLAPPGGNATGFTAYEFSLSAKLLELLKEIAPSVTRVAVIRDASVAAGLAGFAAIQTAAPSFGVELYPVGVRDAAEIEGGIMDFAPASNAIGVASPGTVALGTC